jgi:hypothetical protein
MRSTELTEAQADALSAKLRPMLAYLNRLHARMEKAGFLPDDELLISVKRASDAVHDLSVRVHYLSCKGQVG